MLVAGGGATCDGDKDTGDGTVYVFCRLNLRSGRGLINAVGLGIRDNASAAAAAASFDCTSSSTGTAGDAFIRCCCSNFVFLLLIIVCCFISILARQL